MWIKETYLWISSSETPRKLNTDARRDISIHSSLKFTSKTSLSAFRLLTESGTMPIYTDDQLS